MMKNSRSNQISLPPELKWPQIKWQSEMWLTLIPFILSFVVFFYPQLETELKWRMIVGIPLLFSPLIAPLVVWGCKAVTNAILRIDKYPWLHKLFINRSRELDQLKNNTYNLLQSTSLNFRFEISQASFYRKRYYITLKKIQKQKLKNGDKLIVLDLSDGLLMGHFEVIEDRETEYYAYNIGRIDPVWSGHIRKHGEVNVNPLLIAFYIPQGDVTYEQ